MPLNFQTMSVSIELRLLPSYDATHQLKRMTAGNEDWLYVYTANDERILSYQVGGNHNNRWTLRDSSGMVFKELTKNRVTNTWTDEKKYFYKGRL